MKRLGLLGITPLCAVLAATNTGPSSSSSSSSSSSRSGLVTVSRNEEQVLLFAVRLDGRLLTDALPGYKEADGVIIPLGELSRLLGFAIRVDPVKGTASGYLMEESRRFHLDLQAGTVEIGGKRLPIERTRVELHRDEIFVDTRELSRWLPVDFKIDTHEAVITVVAREKLPVQLAWERERKGGRLRTDFSVAPATATPVADPWRWADVPMVDQTLTVTSTPGAPGEKRRTGVQSSTYAAGDLLWLSANGYAFWDDQRGFTERRFTMGRWDPEGRQLGPLRAKEFAFGTIFSPGANLVSQPIQGTGAMVSSYPLAQDSRYDRHSFRGNLPPGWSVELYQNQALISFQSAREDGLYEFLSVPLRFGPNDFRLVFYGPEGQRREETHRFDVSRAQTPVGEFRYRALSLTPKGRERRDQLEGSYGLTEHFTGTFGYNRLVVDGILGRVPEARQYAQAGVQLFSSRLSGNLDAVSDGQGGSLVELGLRTGLGMYHGVYVKRDQLRNFTSEVFNSPLGQLSSRTAAGVYSMVPLTSFNPLYLQADVQRDEFQAGTQDRAMARLSTNVGRLFLSNQVTWEKGTGVAGSTAPTTTGTFLASRYFDRFSFRGQADYNLRGVRRLESMSAIIDTQAFLPWYMQATVTRQMLTGITTYGASVQKYEGKLGVGLRADYSRQAGFSAALTLSVGLAREPRTGRWTSQARPGAPMGAVSARAFLDANGNGRFDTGEKPLQGAAVAVNGGARPAVMEDDRVSFVRDVSPGSRAFVNVDPNSLEDPYLRSTRGVLSFLPRMGRTLPLDFPMVMTGEVDGTVYLQEDGGSRPYPGMELELVDRSGKVVKAVPAAYDGFFDLDQVIPGDYTLRLNPKQVAELGLVAPAPLPLRFEPTGTVLNGRNLVLQPPAPPKVEPPAPKAPEAAPLPPKIVLDEATLHFATNKAVLAPDGVEAIRKVAEGLLAYRGEFTMRVVGYTDSTGRLPFNKDLSRRRAEAVAKVLTQAGLPAARIESLGRGPENPIADNGTIAGRARNRRVEIEILTKDGQVVTRGNLTSTQEDAQKTRPAPRKGKRTKPAARAALGSTESGPRPELAVVIAAAPTPIREASVRTLALAAAVQSGDRATAFEQSRQHLATLPSGQWTVCLEVAWKEETVRRAWALLPGREAELFLMPILLEDVEATQVFLGAYPSAKAAWDEIRSLPAPFHARRNFPRPFRLDRLPTQGRKSPELAAWVAEGRKS